MEGDPRRQHQALRPGARRRRSTHAVAALGSSLQAIEIGNEPDLYSQYKSDTASTSPNSRLTSRRSRRPCRACRSRAPTPPVRRPARSRPPSSAAEAGLPHPNIVELTSHYYPLSDCSSASDPTIAQLLGTTVRNSETTAADGAATPGEEARLPAVLDEGNSVVCEGMPGVSDVYASALWEIDEQLAFAREGVSGDYMHGTVLQCDTGKPLFMYYTPLCAPTAADASAGTLAAQPEYYGLAAVHEIGAGDFLNVTQPGLGYRACLRGQTHGRHDDRRPRQREDPATNGPTTLQLSLGATFASGSRIDLTASALTAKTGITLGGQTVQSNGTLPAPTKTPVTVSGSTLTVSIPAGSAALITLSGQSSGGGATTTLVGGLSGKCLSVTGGSTAAGATADINTCDGSASQNWTLNANGTIVGGLSGKCLEVTNGSTADRAAVDIGTCTGAANQQWAVHNGGTVVGAQSGKCLSVLGASAADGAAADIYTCNGSPSENWTER